MIDINSATIKENPSYYAILTAEVRYSKVLKANEKLLYSEITALSEAKGRCFASNKYFSRVFGVSTTSISKWISNLVKEGFINRNLLYIAGTKQIDKRYLTIIKGGYTQKVNRGVEEKLKDSTTSINNTSINTKRILPTRDELSIIFYDKVRELRKEKLYRDYDYDKRLVEASFIDFYHYYKDRDFRDNKKKVITEWKGKTGSWLSGKMMKLVLKGV